MCIYNTKIRYTHTHTYIHTYIRIERQKSERKYTKMLTVICVGEEGRNSAWSLFSMLSNISIDTMKKYSFFIIEKFHLRKKSVFILASCSFQLPSQVAALLSCLLRGFISCFTLSRGSWPEILFSTSSQTLTLSRTVTSLTESNGADSSNREGETWQGRLRSPCHPKLSLRKLRVKAGNFWSLSGFCD